MLQETERVMSIPISAAADSEVLRLTWAVIDGVATDADRRRLQELVSSEYQARDEYVKAVRLDSELVDVLNPTKNPANAPRRAGRATGSRPAVLPPMAPPSFSVRATG